MACSIAFNTFGGDSGNEPPSVGINWYVPLPGSPDYDKLKAEGVIDTDDPHEWRRIGEVNHCRVYADVPEDRFRELFKEAERLAYVGGTITKGKWRIPNMGL